MCFRLAPGFTEESNSSNAYFIWVWDHFSQIILTSSFIGRNVCEKYDLQLVGLAELVLKCLYIGDIHKTMRNASSTDNEYFSY